MKSLHLLVITGIAVAFVACKNKSESSDDPMAAVASSVAAMTAKLKTSPEAMSKGAREQFEKQFSCPTERVDVKRRTDLEAPPASTATPPDEVKADPGRLAKWQTDHEADKQFAQAKAADHVKFEINGCGHSQVLDCRPHHGPNGAVYPDWADCSEVSPSSGRPSSR